MKSRAFVIVALLTVGAVGSMQAQTSTTDRANIPFAFHVGDSVLPPGEYRVTYDAQNGMTMLANQDTRKTVFLLTNAVGNGEPVESGRLEFHRYGDNYFLARIWSANYDSGREVNESRAEREMAANFRITPVAAAQVPLH